MKEFLIVAILILVPACCLTQEFSPTSYRKDLNIKLSVIDEKRIEKAVEILNEAQLIENEALSTLQNMSDSEKVAGVSAEYIKTIKKLIEQGEHDAELEISKQKGENPLFLTA